MVRISEGSGSMSEFKRDRKDYHMVGKCVPKKDSNQLLLGKPVFMDDIVPQDCLVVKLLRSPHAHALVEEVKTVAAASLQSSGYRSHLYLERCAERTLLYCRTDLSGAISV